MAALMAALMQLLYSCPELSHPEESSGRVRSVLLEEVPEGVREFMTGATVMQTSMAPKRMYWIPPTTASATTALMI